MNIQKPSSEYNDVRALFTCVIQRVRRKKYGIDVYAYSSEFSTFSGT